MARIDALKRETRRDRREIRRVLGVKSVGEAVGPITPGCEIYGLTGGDFSLIDLIEHALVFTGPARGVLSTWTAAGADITFAYRLMSCGQLVSLRFLVDFSFPARQPAYCEALRQTFGDGCIRITKNHCKFVLLQNARWNLVIRTSMNLNENRRLESFEISDDPAMAKYLEETIDRIFSIQPSAGQFDKRPIDHCHEFETLVGRGEPGPIRESQDVKRFYNDGAFENDLRRVGLNYL